MLKLLVDAAAEGGCCVGAACSDAAAPGSAAPAAVAATTAAAPLAAEAAAAPQPAAPAPQPAAPALLPPVISPAADPEPWRSTVNRQRWLRVLADIVLTDQQISEILSMRTSTLRALNTCFAEREALADRLLTESLAAGGSASALTGSMPRSMPSAPSSSTGGALRSAAGTPRGEGPGGGLQLTAQADRMRQSGYLSDVARSSLSVRRLVQQIEGSLRHEGELLSRFTLRLMTHVLAPVQAAVMVAESFPFATGERALLGVSGLAFAWPVLTFGWCSSCLAVPSRALPELQCTARFPQIPVPASC
jgi:hypothetical protein